MRTTTAASTIAAALVALACGSCSKSNPAPAPTPTPEPGSGATITITASGTSPRNLTVQRGTQVTFVNNDTRPHQMNSDPHPTHGDCPELDQVGFLSAGQSRQSGNLNVARSCGYHDHLNPTTASLSGTITIQ
jgi:plastocyanin